MGRATWDSLPPAVRPLPGRTNVVLSRQPDWAAPGAVVARSLAEALDQPGDVWVIGGASVYRAALPLADLVVITELAQEFDGDTWAPELGPAWRVGSREPASGWLSSRTGLDHRVITYLPVSVSDAR
jgi:dihydrofolate reductase